MTRTPRMRPQFELPVGDRGRLVLLRLGERLDDPHAVLNGQVRGDFAFVRLPEERRSLLSPHLELEIRESRAGTVLHGRFSPRPNVWTGFMGLFIALGMLGFIGLMYGFAQLMLDRPIWMMWSAPVSLALIAFIYGAAFIGQGLSNDEMYELRAFVEDTVREVCGNPDLV
ncbi:MAG: hypothetical protein HKN20_01555 [Gemmatimonadetes bacterium]|nr:hypothetical protein [Gemmatimonadota bacterium]